LKKELEEHKVREENLKKELKRVLRANTAAAALAKETATSAVIKSKVKKEQSPVEEQQKQKITAPMTPIKSPVKLKKVLSPMRTPIKSKEILSPKQTPARSPASSGPVHTPTSGIRPLQPSRREIAKPRYSPPFVSPTGRTQIKSPTGVIDAE
jgi:hypothetical protein